MKILVVRFSSIGDIVLTTPVLRCIRQQLPGAQIHYLTKQGFRTVIEHNPNVDKFFYIRSSVKEVMAELKAEKYDLVIDLHRNTRTMHLKLALGIKAVSFDKLNWEKFLLVRFRINKLPNKHIVDRYFDILKPWKIQNDQKGLDYYIGAKDDVNVPAFLPASFQQGYIALVAGGSYYTKRIPENKLHEICNTSPLPLVLLGGPEDAVLAEKIAGAFPGKVFNACGKININQSASLLKQAQKVITSDTGLMHIAAAFKKPVISLWGNTVPEFGMYPYYPGEGSKLLEVKGLSCRPCSKLGYSKCPKGHFKCMNEMRAADVFR